MTAPEPSQVVASGYGLVSNACQDDRGTRGAELSRAWVGRLAVVTPPGARVLDLGCGAGVPVARDLAERFEVVGVDVSPVQIARANRLVPGATFRCADMAELTFLQECFRAVVCLYVIIHVPVGQQRALLERVASWLVPGGHLLITVGDTAWTGTEDDGLGVEGDRAYLTLALGLPWLVSIPSLLVALTGLGSRRR